MDTGRCRRRQSTVRIFNSRKRTLFSQSLYVVVVVNRVAMMMILMLVW